MTKTFTYEIDDDYNFDEIKYTVYHDELLEAVSFFIYEEYFKNTDLADRCDYAYAVKKGIERFVEEGDTLESLVEDYEDQIKEYFEEDAYEYHKNRG